MDSLATGSNYRSAHATIVLPRLPDFFSNALLTFDSISSGSAINSQRASSLSGAPTKHNSHTPSPPSVLTGGPKTRHVIGRCSYKSHVPVSGSSAGHGSSFPNASNAFPPSTRIPVLRFPGKSFSSLRRDSSARLRTAAARPSSFSSNLASPSRNLIASNWLISNTPTQHWQHPGLHASHAPHAAAFCVSAASTICTSLRSAVGLSSFPLIQPYLRPMTNSALEQRILLLA